MPREKSFNYIADYSVFGIQPVNQKIGFQYHREVLTTKNYSEVLALFQNAEYSSIDTETTSLECANTQLITVNFSVRVDADIRSYVAFYDLGYCESWFKNKLDRLPSRWMILQLVAAALGVKKACVFHNRLFDQRVLLLSVQWDKLCTTAKNMAEDTTLPSHAVEPCYDVYSFMNCPDNLALWFQMDSNVLKGLGLKELAKEYLGLPMEHFDEAVGLDILNSEPKQLLDYGALDTYATLSLYLYAFPRFKAKCPLLARLLPQFTTALYDLEEVKHPVDKSHFEALLEDVTQEIEKVKAEFYANYGVINLGSAVQKSDLLSQLGWSTGVFNKPRPDGTPVMSTKAEHLEKIAKEGCDAARLMIKYNELIKFQSSYCKAPLDFITDSATGEERPWRCHILESRVPTLRLAAGKYTLNRKPYLYFAPLNMMALPKPAQVLRGLDYDPKTFDFKFYPDKDATKGRFFVETYSDKFNMRAAFIPPTPDYICVKCDFSSEEVRAQACESNERVWIDAFKKGEDIYWACYSPDTEFLTRDGFKTYDKITENTLIAAFDPETGHYHYEPAGPVHYGESDDLVSIENKTISLLVTSNHRCYVKTSSQNPAKIVRADSLKSHLQLHSSLQEGGETPNVFEFDPVLVSGRKYADSVRVQPSVMASWIGFHLGDGCCAAANTFVYSQSEGAKHGEGLRFLRALLASLEASGLTFHEHLMVSSGSSLVSHPYSWYDFRASNKNVYSWFTENLYSEGEKILPEFVFDWALELRLSVLKAFFMADGTDFEGDWDDRHRFVLVFSPKELKLKEGIERLAFSCGYAVRQMSPCTRALRISVGTFDWSHVGNQDIQRGVKISSPTVCYSVSTGVLIVRRNGKITVCGNTARGVYGIPEGAPKDRAIRKKGKIAVLSGAYAKPGSYYTYQEKLEMSQEEAIEFEAKLRGGIPAFTNWKLKTYQIARVQGYVQNRYGHIRSVRRYLETRSKHYLDYADKTSVSEMIQGLCGVITRIFCVKLWNLLYGPNRKYNKGLSHDELMDPAKCEVSWLVPIHDEIQLFCKKSLVMQVTHELKAIMESCTPPSYEIKLEAAPEIGPDFGHLVEVHFETIDGVEYLMPDEEPRPTDEKKEEPEIEVPHVEDDSTEEMAGFEF